MMLAALRFHLNVRHSKDSTEMTIDNAVLSFAGLMVLTSLALGYFHSEYWYLFTAVVGLNLLQAGFTGLCPAAMIFKRLGLNPGTAFK